MNEENLIGFDALYTSMEKCKRGVLWKNSAANYYLHGIEQTIKLESELKRKIYKGRKPVRFTITSPKRRDIVSIHFRDRIYQRSLNDNAIYPRMSKGFIRENCACQNGKGNDFAIRLLESDLRAAYRKHGRAFYVLKCDIKGYYPNMSHEAVDAVFKEKLDPNVYVRAMDVLNSQYAGDCGYNPGSQMVQIAGISLPSKLDHYIKEKLRIRWFIRYQDDYILLHHDKEYLERCLCEIRQRLGDIKCQMNEKKTAIFPITDGIQFLGFTFRVSDTGKVYKTILSDNVKRERRKLKRLVHLAKSGKITRRKVDQSLSGWIAHAKKGNSTRVIERMIQYYRQLWEEDTCFTSTTVKI